MASKPKQLEQAIQTLETQRAVLGDEVVNVAIESMHTQLAALKTHATTEQRKQVTVLFADISDFTSMAEKVDAEVIQGMLNLIWNRLDAAIIKQGGKIDKHLGDAVMAIFGAPTAREDDPERAIRAALKMQAELAQFSAAPVDPFESWIPINRVARMRIGIHTGPVLLGNVGLTAEYTAIGDTVNLTSRLQYSAPVGGILVSHETYMHVRGIFDVKPLGEIDVRGRVDSAQVYLIKGIKPRAFQVLTRGIEGIETRMIGRSNELKTLKSHLTTTLPQNKMQILTIVGEAGIGKSRLAIEFDKWLELQEDELWFFRGRTIQQMNKSPYSLIRDMFAFRFEIQDSDRATVVRQKLETGIVSFMGADGVEVAHFIGQLIGYEFKNSMFLKAIVNDALQIRNRAFRYFTQFFKTVTMPPEDAGVLGGGPTIIFFDDIHWADDGSLDLIAHLVQSNPDIPLLIVCLARPSLFQRRPDWGEGWENHTQINLDPLTPDESYELIRHILKKVKDIPNDLQTLIVNASAGNPYYVEELIKKLIDDGVIITNTDEWQIAPGGLAQSLVPPTLTGVLQARLDNLPAKEREILQCASAVGRVFWDTAVAHLLEETGQGIDEIRQLLKNLQSKEMIFRRRAPAFNNTEEYIFKHTVLHDVTYESVLIRKRSDYHNRVSHWLIEQSGERVKQYAGLIGKHFEQARKWAEAVEWYSIAGQQAASAYVSAAAEEFFQKALNLLSNNPDPASEIPLYEGSGTALRIQARYAEAAQAFEAMRMAASEANNVEAQARAWVGLSWVQDVQGNYQASYRSATNAESTIRASGDNIELARALFRKGWSLYRLGNGKAAVKLGLQSIELSMSLGARREMANSMSLLGAAYLLLGRHDIAIRHQRDALELFREIGDRDLEGVMFQNLGLNALSRGDHEKALELFLDALDIAREIGNKTSEIMRLSYEGSALVGLGKFEKAERVLQQAIEMALETDSWGGFSRTYRYLAEAYLGQGKRSEALPHAREALNLGQLMDSQNDIGAAWRVLALSIANRPKGVSIANRTEGQIRRYDTASCFAESLRVFSEAAMEGEKARTLRTWAMYERKRDNNVHALEMWEQAQKIFSRLSMHKELARMQELAPFEEAPKKGQ